MKTRKTGKKNLSANELAFIDDVSEALHAQKTPASMVILYMIAAIIIVGLVWAKFARVEEITQGEAKIIPASREQIVQSLEGGILEELGVQEGDMVKKGDMLLKIDPTHAGAIYREGYSKLIGLQGTIARLRAEAYSIPLEFPNEVKAVPSIVRDETLAYKARKKALEESISSIQHSYELAQSEIKMSVPLSARGLISNVEILRMKRSANDLLMQIAERKNRFQAEANAELSKLELEYAQTKENLVGREDVFQRTTIAAPVNGTIKNIRVNTIGGVIQPGEPIMEIIPLEDKLLVEAKIKPSDVAFLRQGLPAMVKISAYDFGIYGGLKGKVTLISPDTLREDPQEQQKPGETYYRVYVLTDNNALHANGKILPIIPGMTATVEIRTGEKTILDYIMKPVLKAREAFRER
ncbi:HlyD family type I secretion periplasmic adaptor subunit [Salmonella enterica]|nr:HlyD family type I secretion periplasmic adaptor subunit [Salmonella enterica]ECW8875839.1 HlyD family type I secretion periplasmic adaptor subunit [Salmonella enterica]EIL1178318.1 HlyD family type I secretion periplasmic adaptor subunit [Salmonella enterica]EIO9955911.1 HlyD family type I secretion periplasmic adaptor subunit [Salmonella enterica]EIV5116117.1 HlyD family type I secretion periplasmic adaptor subunit [Salmonella enterica]